MDTVERISGFRDLRKVTGRIERLFISQSSACVTIFESD